MESSARAQEELDEGPVNTLPDEPEPLADTPPAPPAPEQDKKARELFEQGRKAYDDGNYRDAWDYFRQAYLLSRRPQLLYNVGQSADRLRKDREALEAFQLYLKRLPEAENRKEVENRIRALQERLAAAEGDATPASDSGQSGELSQEERSIFGKDAATENAPTGQPERTGFYARVGVGLGLLGDSLSNSVADSMGSPTLASHIGLGYDVDEGFVVGGGVGFEWGLSPRAKRDNGSVEIESANVTLLIVFVDYFIDPRRDGWHLLGGLGAGALSLSDTTATVGIEDAGLAALVLGGGYEWPIDNDWAIGALGRLILARGSQDTADHNLATFSAMFTAAWY